MLENFQRLFLVILLFLALSTAAKIVTTTGECPPPEDIVYSPFKPWFHFYGGSRQSCWTAAICTLLDADEARKQQFAATALIMGLVPLTLKDIAWPERRIVLVSAPLPFAAAIIVRALGLEPMLADEVESTQKERFTQWIRNHRLIANVRARSLLVNALLLAACFALLLVSYLSLAAIEIYSKRSALGCTYPVFGLTWCIVGFLPASLHTFFAARERHKKTKSASDLVSRSGSVSAVQGADEAWPVQLAWAIYYIAGTLVYTSIMAITVAELAVWVLVLVAVTAASKMFALYVCLLLRNPELVAD